MRFSEITMEDLSALPYTEKWNIVCGDIRDDGKTGEIALLLGTDPEMAIPRAHAAAQLYRQGRVQYVVASGGVEWEYQGEMISEAALMARVLVENGVPEDAIILDNEARTTRENMICGTLAIERAMTFKYVEHVIVVTSQGHMQRSLALARAFLPRKVSVSGYPCLIRETPETWLKSQENCRLLDHALRMTKRLVDFGIVEDLDI